MTPAQAHFGADPHVLGRRILVDEDPYTIVGVNPPNFRHPAQTLAMDVGLWAGCGMLADPMPTPIVRARRLVPGAIARLKPGVSVQQAQQRLDALVVQLRQTDPRITPPPQDGRCGWNRCKKAGLACAVDASGAGCGGFRLAALREELTVGARANRPAASQRNPFRSSPDRACIRAFSHYRNYCSA